MKTMSHLREKWRDFSETQTLNHNLNGERKTRKMLKKMSQKENSTGLDSDVEDVDLDRESNDSDNSSTKTELSDTSSDSEGSSMDEEECERRRNEFMEDLVDLEQQFTLLREQLYRERFTQVDSKLLEIRSGRAQEYLVPLQQLQENMNTRTEVAGVLKQLSLHAIDNFIDSEKSAATQNLKEEQELLLTKMKEDCENRIRKLEEDRNNIDVSTTLWGNEQPRRNSKSRKKPVTVSGPHIVYMLTDSEILHDWTIIKKCLTNCNRKYELSL